MMRAALDGTTRIESVRTLDEAVARAAAEALPGDTVLLSPACASFDQFKNYAERGRIFQELVRAL
jgi:UDP-N-acetylmuramoylalanine--D-glutamate ligase